MYGVFLYLAVLCAKLLLVGVWDTPPLPGSLEWDSYKKAVSRYVFAQSVEVPRLTKEEEKKRDNRPWRDISHWTNQDWQPKLDDKSLSLMPFQVSLHTVWKAMCLPDHAPRYKACSGYMGTGIIYSPASLQTIWVWYVYISCTCIP